MEDFFSATMMAHSAHLVPHTVGSGISDGTDFPKSNRDAFKTSQWAEAIYKEFNALFCCKMWKCISIFWDVWPVTSKWKFKAIKLKRFVKFYL